MRENPPSLAGVMMETVSCSRLCCRPLDKKNVTVNEGLSGMWTNLAAPWDELVGLREDYMTSNCLDESSPSAIQKLWALGMGIFFIKAIQYASGYTANDSIHS